MSRRGEAAKKRAVETLAYYFKTLYEAVGVKWSSDNEAEIKGIIEDVVAAAVEESRA